LGWGGGGGLRFLFTPEEMHSWLFFHMAILHSQHRMEQGAYFHRPLFKARTSSS
jgi:hypothetical protein